jgi:2-oxoglutarate ferredoxin oxidoreductase subunit delta
LTDSIETANTTADMNLDTTHRRRGTVVVQTHICKGCSYCLDFCPSHCLDFSKEFNGKGYHYPVLARPEDCSGCDLCGLYCPDFAIHGVRFKDLEKHASAGGAPAMGPDLARSSAHEPILTKT